MGRIRTLTDGEVERLLSGRATAAGDARLEQLAAFVRGLGATVPRGGVSPDPVLITRLADAAAGGAGAPVAAPERLRTRGRRRLRAGLIARVGIAVAMVPVLFAGLAVAGVTLPGPARDAFDRLGLELPNQASDDSADDNGSGSDGGEGKSADDPQSSNGKGEVNRRAKRKAYGPSGSARPNPPGKAVRRGPNPTPGTPRGKPQSSPSSGGNAGVPGDARGSD
jgi:hypothetical protein